MAAAARAGGKAAELLFTLPRAAQAERCSSAREEKALAQHGSHEAPPTGTQRQPNREFALTTRRSDEREVGQIGAGDQQQHGDGAEQQ